MLIVHAQSLEELAANDLLTADGGKNLHSVLSLQLRLVGTGLHHLSVTGRKTSLPCPVSE